MEMAMNTFARIGWLLMAAWLCVPSASAQPPRTRPGADPVQPPPRVRPGADQPQPPPRVRPGEQPAAEPGQWPRTRQPTRRGAARGDDQRKTYSEPRANVRIAPGNMPPSRNWYLGIQPVRAPRGVRITGVLFNTPAQRFGLESGDYILDVSGYVVGEYQGSYYPLAMAMDYGADANGWAELLVWNRRTFAEETLWVQFRRR
jgi:hypothetical protein